MCIKYDSEANGFLDITIGQKWDYISITRTYVENFLKHNLINKVKIAKMIIAASELLENAVKYANKNGVRTKIKKNLNQNQIEISVYNYAGKPEAEKLIKYIYDVDNIQNPNEFYMEKMKEAVRFKKNGLGIPRIRCESEAHISADYFDDTNGNGTLRVIATFNI